MENILDRFLRYVAVDTQSDPESESQPSSARQLDLLKMLCAELQGMGVEASLDEYGYVMASIPSNCGKDVPSVGFIAHVDTSPDASGKDIRPQIIRNYDGGDILLNAETGLSLKTDEFPELKAYAGQTIITTFTPDEEIGRGVVKFDVARFGAKYAYTMDGGAIGELEYENFNAASATVSIQGRNIHPGYAKGKMLNAILIGMEMNSLLPVEQRPEYTDGYEGFLHIVGFNGTVEEATFSYIIRDHDMKLFEEKKEMLRKCVDFINFKYGEGVAKAEIKHQYYNMRKEVEPHYHIIEKAVKAMEMEGITPHIQPIRGGTDGANLSFMGLPCPNIFAGGHNFHGKMEYVPLESMEKASKVILNIISLFAE